MFLFTTFLANVADPDPGPFFDPWIRDGEKSRSGIRIPINIPDHIFEGLEIIFGFKILQFLDADPGSGIFLTLDPGSVM